MRISASAKGVQCCVALTPWLLFFLRAGHRHTRVCRGAAPDPGANGDWDAFQDQLVFPVSATNMFQEPYLQFLFLYIQVYSFDAIICMLHGEEDHVLERHWPLTETFS